MTAQTKQIKTAEDYLRDFTAVCRKIVVSSVSNLEELEKLDAAIAHGRSQGKLRTDQLTLAAETFISSTGCPQSKVLMQGFLERIAAEEEKILAQMREIDVDDDW